MKKISLALTALALSQPVFANKTQHQFYKSEESAVIDGTLDETVWESATSYNLNYNVNPGDSTPAPVKTEVKLYGSNDSLFVAFVAHDPNPENIRAYYRDRDTIFQDDFVGVVIDTFNDERRAYEFFVNALGVQGDLIKDETKGGSEDENWDAIWDSAAQITDSGYVVEMEIPYKALRFPAGQSELVWGIDAMRVYPRDSRMVLASSKSDREVDCHLCQIDKLSGIKNLSQGNNFQLIPTITTIKTDSRETLNEDDEPTVLSDWESGSADPEFGIDMRWGINQDLILNATINPDFSQVEADAAQLDVNNTFSLFFPEKRTFFLDGKDYFDTSRMNLVHTRNIAAPDYGFKLTGKNDQHTYGALIANDESTNFLMPESLESDIAELDIKSTIAIGRYRMDVGERSNVGVLVTGRQGDGYRNTVASIDGKYQMDKANSLTYQFAYSDSKNPQELQDDFEVAEEQSDSAVSVGYNHNTRNYNLRANYVNFGEDFRSDLGFVGRTGYERAVLGGRYTWYGEEDSKWTRWGVFGDWDKTYDSDGKMLEEEVEIHGNVQGPMQFYTNFGAVHRKRYWDGEYFDETNLMVFARFDPLPNLRLGGFVRVGDQVDYANTQLGDTVVIEAFANLKLGKHVTTEFDFVRQTLDVAGGKLFTANQIDLRFNYQFNLKSYIRLVIQSTDIERDVTLYTDEDDDVDSNNKYLNTQLIYAYKINPQTLFYLGYADKGFQDDYLDSLEKDNRSIFMKMSYAWQL